MAGTNELASFKCTKNPKHRDFIPVQNLTAKHLPKPYNSAEWVEFIQLMAQETVKLTVNSTSAKRTEQYGFTEYIGTNRCRCGSGTAFLMDMGIPQRCPIKDCIECEGRSQTTGIFKVVTAAHIVCDDSEAANTIVEFFYDYENEMSRVVRARGIRTSSVDIGKNRCVFECVTHNQTELFRDLQTYRLARAQLLPKLQEKLHLGERWTEMKPDDGFVSVKNNTQLPSNLLVVLVSHPHGCAKHVSVGRLIGIERDGVVRRLDSGEHLVGCVLSYTAATCLGSAGGSANVFGVDTICLAFAPHCFTKGDGKNVSGLGWTVSLN